MTISRKKVLVKYLLGIDKVRSTYYNIYIQNDGRFERCKHSNRPYRQRGFISMTATTIISGITKEVKYDRETRDYACFVSIDGGAAECIGYAKSYHDGENLCDRYAYDYLSDNNTDETAAELVIKMDIRTAAERTADLRSRMTSRCMLHQATI